MSRHPKFAAMLSYSHVDLPWVEVLHGHLQRCLDQKVFLDKLDIAAGQSWVRKLQHGLEQSHRVILVATPESLASPRVADEWEAAIAARSDWRRDARLLVALLRPVPLPAFVNSGQYVDFVDHDDEKYRLGLRQLLAVLRGHTDYRDLPPLPDDLQPPVPPTDPLGSDLRQRAVDWLAEYLQGRDAHFAVANLFDLSSQGLREAFPGNAGIASAAVVRATLNAKNPRSSLQDRLQPFRDLAEEQLAERLEALLAELAAPPAGEGLPPAVASWLDFEAWESRELEPVGPRKGGPRRRPLETLYVELRVSEGRERRPAGSEAGMEGEGPSEPRKDGGEGLGGGRLRMEDLLLAPAASSSKTPSSAARAATGPHRHWVVLGGPGAGKTTLLRHLARHFAGQRSPLRLVPVLVSLPQVLAWDRWFLDELESKARQDGYASVKAPVLETLGREADPAPLLILADGLDEVSRERRSKARGWIERLAERWPAARVVVTSRFVPYEPLEGGFQEVTLQPLDDEARVDLVARHLAAGDVPTEEERRRAERHVAELRQDPWLWDWAGNPLYLGFLALLLRQGEVPSRRRHALYGQVIDLMLECRQREDQPGVEPRDTVRELLAVLAHRMTVDNEDEVSRGWLERLLVANDEEVQPLRDRLLNSGGVYHSKGITAFLDEVPRSGLLTPEADPDWRFHHRTFREALTAEHLARQARTKEGLEEVLRRAAALGETEDWQQKQEDQARWAEPFALLAGQMEDRDGLVTALVGANRELGLRALASTHDLRRETVVALLEAVKANHERADVIRSFPQVLASLDKVLDLVDALRRGTRNGDDLFWLYWVVQEVERRAETEGNRELAGDARARLGRFFDHIDPPPVEVFGEEAEVETGRDGRVPLWCTIPPEGDAGSGGGVVGSFRMGSPEGEGFPDEQPQHQVEFRSRFRMAAVPVTRTQYALFDPEHRSHDLNGVPGDELRHHPVNQVSWWAAVSFCRWLSRSLPELAGARLPTETEWEYACRAGRETPYWNGKGEAALKEVGWYDGNSGRRTHRVGELLPNPWGLYDVHGNVWEWTVSPWTGDYSDRRDGQTEDPIGLDAEALIGNDPGGGGRVFRGGSFVDVAGLARSAVRNGGLPWYRWWVLGFRVALPAAPSDLRS